MKKFIMLYLKISFLIMSCQTKSSEIASTKKLHQFKLDTLIDAIAKTNIYGNVEIQQSRFKQLRADATEEELEKLCDHENPIARCYAFMALVMKCSEKTFDILIKHLSDTAEFKVVYGCFNSTDRVTEIYLNCVNYCDRKFSPFSLNEVQTQRVNSILLFGKAVIRRTDQNTMEFISRWYMLENLNPLPGYYNRIKEVALAGVPEATVPLAKYKNPDDIYLIKKMLLENKDDWSTQKAGLKAIPYFPHPQFYPILKNRLKEIHQGFGDEKEWSLVCAALAQYKTLETRQIFKKELAQNDPRVERNLYYILKNNPAKIFEGLVNYTQTPTR